MKSPSCTKDVSAGMAIQTSEDQNPWLRQLLEGRRDGPIETIQRI